MQLSRPADRVLIVCLRRLGDVLLSTPLAISIQSAWPQARVDWLVFSGTEGILQSNPAAQGILTIPPDASVFETLRLMRSIFRRYDLAISVQAGDRPSLLAWVAGRHSITIASAARGARLRSLFFSGVVAPIRGHRVDQVLALLQPLGLPAFAELSPPKSDDSMIKQLFDKPYVVLHPGAAFIYKRWTNAGWFELAERLLVAGYGVAVTGGSNDSERRYLDQLFSNLDVLRLDGILSWPQLVGLLRDAAYFVGVDTSVTHLAAACGCSGVAVFGPTDPKIWGPLPYRGLQKLVVVQNDQSCVPCQQEGCDRHLESHALCLDTLDWQVVWSRLPSRRPAC